VVWKFIYFHVRDGCSILWFDNWHPLGHLVEFFGDRIIIDSGLGRDAQCKEWIWPPSRSPEWIKLIQCTPTFSWMMVGMAYYVGRTLQRICSLFLALGTLFVLFETKLSDGNLFGINRLFHDFHLSCGLLLKKLRCFDIIQTI